MANYPFEKVLMCTLFEREGGSKKVYVLYTHLNVDNYGRALTIKEINGYFFQTNKNCHIYYGNNIPWIFTLMLLFIFIFLNLGP